MATADLKLVYGGGGSFRPSFFSGGLTIAAASSGTLFTLTAPVGKKVRLFSLASAPGTSESNIQVTVDGSVVIPTSTLAGSTLATGGSYSVGVMGGGNGGGSGTISNGAIPYLEGLSTIVVSKTTGSTTNTIYYSYAYGD